MSRRCGTFVSRQLGGASIWCRTRPIRVVGTPTRMTSRYLPRMVDSEDDEEGWTTERIDAEFPLGDGEADTEAFVECP